MARKAANDNAGASARHTPHSELMLLFFLYEDEAHSGYSLKQIVQRTRLQEWLPISSMTVYQSLKRLSERGFITGASERNGAYPERTVYTITQEGKDFLDSTIRSELEKYERDYFKFDVCVALSSFVPTREKVVSAKRRIKLLSQRLRQVKGDLENYKTGFYHSPFPGWLLLDHEIAHLKSEISWLRRYIRLISEDYVKSKGKRV